VDADRGGPGRDAEIDEARTAPADSSAPGAAVRWLVLGRVQGVGFRWFVRQQARRWGVRGTVRNLPDGSVEITAAGTPETLEGLMASVRRGPPGADVSDLKSLPVPEGADYPDPFSILRG
jgi:acylphosphatase